MAIKPEVLRALLAHGATAEMIVAAVEADAADGEARRARKREKDAERQRRYRLSRTVTRDGGVTTRDTPLKEIPPTPPKENNPPIPQPSIEGLPQRKLDEAFAEFRAAYPRRQGSDPSEPAKRKLDAALRAGVELPTIVAAARRYGDEQRSLGHVGTPFIKQMAVWLNQKCWQDYGHVNGATGPPVMVIRDADEIIAERIAEREAAERNREAIRGGREGADIRQAVGQKP